MASILRTTTWHPAHNAIVAYFCPHCVHTFTLLINHPALPPLQREELTGLLYTLMNATPETVKGALLQLEQARQQAAVLPAGPSGPPVSARVLGTERDRHVGKEHAFVLEVTWSNGFVQDCRRTHDQVSPFMGQRMGVDSFLTVRVVLRLPVHHAGHVPRGSQEGRAYPAQTHW